MNSYDGSGDEDFQISWIYLRSVAIISITEKRIKNTLILDTQRWIVLSLVEIYLLVLWIENLNGVNIYQSIKECE